MKSLASAEVIHLNAGSNQELVSAWVGQWVCGKLTKRQNGEPECWLQRFASLDTWAWRQSNSIYAVLLIKRCCIERGCCVQQFKCVVSLHCEQQTRSIRINLIRTYTVSYNFSLHYKLTASTTIANQLLNQYTSIFKPKLRKLRRQA